MTGSFLLRHSLPRSSGVCPRPQGRDGRAAAELAEAQQLTADNGYSSIARLMASQYISVPKIRDLFENTFLLGLRRVGLPED